MASIRTQKEQGGEAGQLTAQERARLGGYRASGNNSGHYLTEYEWLMRAYALPECHIWRDADGELQVKVGPLTDTPHPNTPPRIFARLTYLVQQLSAPVPAAQRAGA